MYIECTYSKCISINVLNVLVQFVFVVCVFVFDDCVILILPLLRASKALSQGFSSANHEKLIAVTFCEQATERVKRSLSSLTSSTDLHIDSSMATVAKEITENGSVVATHPLQL